MATIHNERPRTMIQFAENITLEGLPPPLEEAGLCTHAPIPEHVLNFFFFEILLVFLPELNPTQTNTCSKRL